MELSQNVKEHSRIAFPRGQFRECIAVKVVFSTNYLLHSQSRLAAPLPIRFAPIMRKLVRITSHDDVEMCERSLSSVRKYVTHPSTYHVQVSRENETDFVCDQP